MDPAHRHDDVGASHEVARMLDASSPAEFPLEAYPFGLNDRSLLERIPAVTYLAGFGEAGTWLYVSPHVERMLGFTPEEWLADPDLWFRQIHPDDRGQALEDEKVSKSTGQPLRSEYRMHTKANQTIWVRDEAVLLVDDEGGPLAWQGFMVDITGRREVEDRLHDSEIRYRSLFDHLPVGLYRTTPTGKILDANRALARLLGFHTTEQLVGLTATDLYIDPSDRERWGVMMETAGIVHDFETQLRRQDGSVIWIKDSARAILDREEHVMFYEGVLQDVTLRKQTEWEARQANQQLSGWINELERRNRETSLINEMGDMLQGCPTVEEAYAVIAHWAEQLFPGRSGAVCVITPSRNVVEPVAVWGMPALGETPFTPDACWALRSGRTHVMADPRSRLVCRHLTEPMKGSALCVPMMAQGEALGILHVQGVEASAYAVATAGPEGRSDPVKQLAVAVAEHLALALANLRLRETLRTQSIRDTLTGLFNRRYMEESLGRELARADRRGHPVGVIMFDLDYFSTFNNTFGHQAGDVVLQSIGELIRRMVRPEDIACRYGGEEFTLILPEAPFDATLARAEELRRAIRDIRMEFRDHPLGEVTASIGVAVYPEHGRTADALIRAADQALYKAKNEGRDRVVAAGRGIAVPS